MRYGLVIVCNSGTYSIRSQSKVYVIHYENVYQIVKVVFSSDNSIISASESLFDPSCEKHVRFLEKNESNNNQVIIDKMIFNSEVDRDNYFDNYIF